MFKVFKDEEDYYGFTLHAANGQRIARSTGVCSSLAGILNVIQSVRKNSYSGKVIYDGEILDET